MSVVQTGLIISLVPRAGEQSMLHYRDDMSETGLIISLVPRAGLIISFWCRPQGSSEQTRQVAESGALPLFVEFTGQRTLVTISRQHLSVSCHQFCNTCPNLSSVGNTCPHISSVGNTDPHLSLVYTTVRYSPPVVTATSFLAFSRCLSLTSHCLSLR